MALFGECDGSHAKSGDTWGRASELVIAAGCARAGGQAEEALRLCERSQTLAGDRAVDFALLSILIRAELAASLLATGDTASAVKLAVETRKEIEDVPAHMHLLRLDLTLAEAERMQDSFDAAVARIRLHAEYILTGSANTMLSLYVRAFPGLLGVLCVALGVEDVPSRMLKLLPSATIGAALASMDRGVSPEARGSLLERLPEYEPASTSAAIEQEVPSAEWPCYVRLLGGLEVTTEFGVVDDSYWRKRKSRLLFAMLVVRQGQELPRDVIIERLWPDMEEASARRNFYVTWSTMKRALACGGAPALGGTYVRTTGNACRISRSVRSDLDDFHDAIGQMRRAKTGASGEVIELARTLADVYRGDLLPGDVYEDWFADAREELRHEFCDAMVFAAGVAELAADPATALLFLRRAAAVDAWREDVYQGMMRCQISAGQRSRAIETYLCCRSRLVEDLGIDPSAETARLYQAILAMEDDAR